jgi:tRNA (guanine37-N1)-methyltransferase
MIFDIITIFPDSFSALNESIVKRAQNVDKIRLNIWNLRNWTDDVHQSVDDKPYGGGAGMVMKVRPLYRALKDLQLYPKHDKKTKVTLTSAKGTKWNQSMAQTYSEKLERLVIICGHYEGVDHRVVQHLIDEEICTGDYVLSGGEIPAMTMVDSITRLIPGVLGNEESLTEETEFNESGVLSEYPHYTRPVIFETDEGKKWVVPDVLVSGNHEEIRKWREGQRVKGEK